MIGATFLSVLFGIFGLFDVSLACPGCLELDEYNFYKIKARFPAVLAKFDVSYPYGEQHDAFGAISKTVTNNPDIVLGLVGIKDYGDNENEAMGKRYGVNSKDDYPALRLFVQGKEEPFSPPEDFQWTQEGIKNFVRDNSGIYIGLEGCIVEYDKIAADFVTSNSKKEILEKTLKKVEKIETEATKTTATIYTKFMSKIVEQDLSFVKQEEARLNKLLKGGVLSERKINDLNKRLNILKSFRPPKVEL